jgi:periplasmic divalent cation tolerance protein
MVSKAEQPCDSHGAPEKTGFFQITATAKTQEQAERLIRVISEKKLAACAQIQGPAANSIVEQKEPWRCRFKTSDSLFPSFKEELDLFFKDGDYTLKALPIVKGSKVFLEWLKIELGE